jgi:hypothetical protein
MLVLWSLCTAAFVALMVYRSHLTRHEIGRVFLNENTDASHLLEHEMIVNRVNRLQPFLQTAGGAAALITVLIVGVFVAEALPHVRF